MESVVNGLSAFQELARGHLVPVGSFREPYSLRSFGTLQRSGHRADDHVVAKHVLIFLVIGLPTVSIIIVHRAAQRKCLIISLAGHRVDIRVEGITRLDDVAQHACHRVREHPRLLVKTGVLRRMAAEDRTEESKLHPADIHLRVNAVRPHVSADVMAPITI